MTSTNQTSLPAIVARSPTRRLGRLHLREIASGKTLRHTAHKPACRPWERCANGWRRTRIFTPAMCVLARSLPIALPKISSRSPTTATMTTLCRKRRPEMYWRSSARTSSAEAAHRRAQMADDGARPPHLRPPGCAGGGDRGGRRHRYAILPPDAEIAAMMPSCNPAASQGARGAQRGRATAAPIVCDGRPARRSGGGGIAPRLSHEGRPEGGPARTGAGAHRRAVRCDLVLEDDRIILNLRAEYNIVTTVSSPARGSHRATRDGYPKAGDPVLPGGSMASRLLDRPLAGLVAQARRAPCG